MFELFNDRRQAKANAKATAAMGDPSTWPHGDSPGALRTVAGRNANLGLTEEDDNAAD